MSGVVGKSRLYLHLTMLSTRNLFIKINLYNKQSQSSFDFAFSLLSPSTRIFIYLTRSLLTIQHFANIMCRWIFLSCKIPSQTSQVILLYVCVSCTSMSSSIFIWFVIIQWLSPSISPILLLVTTILQWIFPKKA